MSEEARLLREIQRLLQHNSWNDFPGWLVEVQAFDEVPLYSRYDEIDFLSHLPYSERNRILIRAAASHLSALVNFVETRRQNGYDDDFFCMLSILDWEEWENSGGESLLFPNIWFTNPSKDILSHIPLTIAHDPWGQVVREWLPEGDFIVCKRTESRGGIQRIYVLKPPMLVDSLRVQGGRG